MKGEIKIRKGNDNQPPSIVYVKGLNPNFNLWVTKVINTDDSYLSKEEDLIEVDYKKFMVMLYEWKIKKNEKILANYENSLKKWS